MDLADRYPNKIDGVILKVDADQAEHISSWCRDSKFNGLCRFHLYDSEYLARSLGMMLANVDTFSARIVSPARMVQIR